MCIIPTNSEINVNVHVTYIHTFLRTYAMYVCTHTNTKQLHEVNANAKVALENGLRARVQVVGQQRPKDCNQCKLAYYSIIVL